MAYVKMTDGMGLQRVTVTIINKHYYNLNYKFNIILPRCRYPIIGIILYDLLRSE